MTAFGIYVDPQIHNVGYMKVYEGLWALEDLIFFLVKFPVEWRQNHVWGPVFVPSYDHVYKNIHFCKG